MKKKTTLLRVVLLFAASLVFAKGYSAPPIAAPEEDGNAQEQVTQPLPSTTSPTAAPASARPAIQMDEGELEQQEAARREQATRDSIAAAEKKAKEDSIAAAKAAAMAKKKAAEEAAAQKKAEAEAKKKAAAEAKRRAAEEAAEKKRAAEEAARKKAEQDSIAEVERKAREDSIAKVRAEQARQDSIKAVERAYQDRIRAAERAYNDSIAAATKARNDSIAKAERDRQDRIRAAERAYNDSIAAATKARNDSIAKAEQTRRDSIQAAERAYNDSIAEVRRIEQARIDSIQERERIRWQQEEQRNLAMRDSLEKVMKAWQDSINMAATEKARQDSIALNESAKQDAPPKKQAPIQPVVPVDPEPDAPTDSQWRDVTTESKLDTLQQRIEQIQKQLDRIANNSTPNNLSNPIYKDNQTNQTNQGGASGQRSPVIVIVNEGQGGDAVQDPAKVAPYNPQVDAEPDPMPISEPAEEPVGHAPLYKRFYEYSGNSALSILSAGYSTYFLFPGEGVNTTQDLGRRHILNFSIFEWRAKLFGMSLFNFEMGINTPHEYPGDTLPQFQRGGRIESRLLPADAKTMWFAYKPAMKFYIPLGRMCALELYGGIEVDVTKLWNKINTSYYEGHSEIPEQNFFFGAYGGTGFVFTAVPALPLEIKAEYRHPVKGNKAIVPQGFYLSAQLHLTAPLRRNNTHK